MISVGCSIHSTFETVTYSINRNMTNLLILQLYKVNKLLNWNWQKELHITIIIRNMTYISEVSKGRGYNGQLYGSIACVIQISFITQMGPEMIHTTDTHGLFVDFMGNKLHCIDKAIFACWARMVVCYGYYRNMPVLIHLRTLMTGACI